MIFRVHGFCGLVLVVLRRIFLVLVGFFGGKMLEEILSSEATFVAL